MSSIYLLHPARVAHGDVVVCPKGIHTAWGIFVYTPVGRFSVAEFHFEDPAEEIAQQLNAERALAVRQAASTELETA